MKNGPFRAFVSFWLMILMLFAVTPLGCNSLHVRHPAPEFGQPYIPEETEERLEECAALVQKDVKPGRHSVDARVTLDADGRVRDATTTGEPNPDVGICIRLALQDMKVSTDIIDEASLRATQAPSGTAAMIPNRAYLGQVETVTVTVVVVVFVDVIIEGALLSLGVAVTATVAQDAVRSAQTRAMQSRKPHQPVAKKWLDNGGSIEQKADGTTVFTRSDGVSVTYDKAGFPDFIPHRHPTVKDVQIEFTGSYQKDFAAADKAAGITEEMRDSQEYTWHHHQDGKTMQLIKRDVHRDFFHTGGMAGTRK